MTPLGHPSHTTHNTSGHTPYRVLLIDDDPQLCILMHEYLEAHAFAISIAHDGYSGLLAAENGDFDIILLDMLLPDMSGLEVLQALLQMKSTPVVMLSAHNEETDRIVALELGADDYVPKSFSPRELLARLRAVMRRSGPVHGSSADGEKDSLSIRGLNMDTATMAATLDGAPLNLTALEFRLLFSMAKEPGRVFTRENLLNTTSDRNFNNFDRSIDMHISSLRRKLNDDPRCPRYFRTIRGVGYSFIKNTIHDDHDEARA